MSYLCGFGDSHKCLLWAVVQVQDLCGGDGLVGELLHLLGQLQAVALGDADAHIAGLCQATVKRSATETQHSKKRFSPVLVRVYVCDIVWLRSEFNTIELLHEAAVLANIVPDDVAAHCSKKFVIVSKISRE